MRNSSGRFAVSGAQVARRLQLTILGLATILAFSAVASSQSSSGTPQVEIPRFTPAGTVFASEQMVMISTATPGASIRYTTDGSRPSSTAGTIYTGAITVNSTETLTAIAYKNGMVDSALGNATFTKK